MGEKDITEKLLEDYPDVFADIFNVLLFNGEKLIKEDELSESMVHSQYKAEDGKLHELERDVTKKWIKNNVSLSMFGIENQTAVEKFMPLRVIGYDGASYRTQLLNLESEKRKLHKLREESKITKEEYISKIKKSYDNICPVITIVLYFGTERHWNESDTLKKLINIPRKLEKFVNDYKIHIFEIAWLSEEQINMMTSDFKLVAQFLRDKRLGKNDIMYDKTKITHIDEILKLLAAMTADRRYTDWLKTDEYKEVDTMCELFDRAMNERIERAMKEKEAQMKEQEEQMKEQEAQMKEQEAQMKEQEAQMKEQEAQMKEQEAQIKENEAQMKEQEAQIKENEAQMKEQEAQIKEQDAIIAELRRQLAVYQNQ